MKKYAAMVAGMLVALLGFAGFAPSAQADTYPPAETPVITLTLSSNSVVSGHKFTATASVDTTCDSLSLSFQGQSASGAGSSVSGTFTAPNVTKATSVPVNASCTYTPSTSGTSGNAIAPTAEVATATKSITVVPAGSGSTTGLPNTGGPSVGWLIGGVAALLAGALAMIAGRRRAGAVTH